MTPPRGWGWGGNIIPAVQQGRCRSHFVDLSTWRWRRRDLKFQASLNDLTSKTLSQQPPNRTNKRQKQKKKREGRIRFHFQGKHADSVFSAPETASSSVFASVRPTPSHPQAGKTQARKQACSGPGGSPKAGKINGPNQGRSSLSGAQVVPHLGTEISSELRQSLEVRSGWCLVWKMKYYALGVRWQSTWRDPGFHPQRSSKL